MTAIAPAGFLRIGASELEYRMTGPAPDQAPTIVMLHEGLGSVGLWGDFPERLQVATGAGVLAYSRAGYGASTAVTLPRPLDYMHVEAREVLPELLDRIGFRRGLLLGHSDGASIATIYAGCHQDHRVQGVALIAPHFVVEDIGLAAIAETRTAQGWNVALVDNCLIHDCQDGGGRRCLGGRTDCRAQQSLASG